MKLAIILTGFVRSYKETFPFLDYYLLSKYLDVDIYLSSWDHTQNNPKISNKQYFPIQITDVTKTYSSQHQRIPPNMFRNYLTFTQNKQPNPLPKNSKPLKYEQFWVDRLRDQWDIVQKGWQLIDNPYKYDLIGRIRFDVLLLSTPDLKKNQLVIPPPPHNMSNIIKFSDHMAFGTPEQMSKYCNLYTYINNMATMIDVSDADEMLKYYLTEFDKKITVDINPTIKYTIMR